MGDDTPLHAQRVQPGCTAGGGRYYVARWGRRYGVFDNAETRGDPLRLFATEVEAQKACERRNAR